MSGRALRKVQVAPMSALRELWLAAADAAEALRHAKAQGEHELPGRSIGKLDDEAQYTEMQLRDHLLTEHGLTTADLKRSVF